MQPQTRCESFDHAGKAEVLHDHGIHAAVFEQMELRFGIRQFLGEDERIEGHVTLHPMSVEEFHQLRQILRREIVRSQPCIEARHAKIDRVGTIGHGGACAVPVTCGR